MDWYNDLLSKKLFQAAEIAKFSKEERVQYENSVKYYRDIKNVVDTSHEEGREEGRVEGREEERVEVARRGIAKDILLRLSPI